MHVYENRTLFDLELSSVKKWMRVGQALDIAPSLLRDVAYSIGDSLTYWWDRTAGLSTLDMVGSTACGLLQRSDELEGARERIAAVARDLLEEPFERYGLAVAELSVEGTYVAPGAQEV